MSKPKKILFAAGGTGGHLFPAQALAEELQTQRPDLELLFVGAKLEQNIYFDRSRFAFQDIVSTTPFRGSFFAKLTSFGVLLEGIRKSHHLLQQKKPDLIVGFGSFHTFPILCAAALNKIPIVLFESNAIPGKVTRLFSKRALFTGIFFPWAKDALKGKTIEVNIPQRNPSQHPFLSPQEARRFFHLDPHRFTLLVFGGSQGAKRINQHLIDLIPLLREKQLPWQIIHFTGESEMTTTLIELCQDMHIPHYVKDFEPQMSIAWQAADIAICRAGAMTLAELLHYEVPAILIPYPFATDHHQLKNALFFETEVKGGIHFLENSLSTGQLMEVLISLSSENSLHKQRMKQAIKTFKGCQKKADLSHLILETLGY